MSVENPVPHREPLVLTPDLLFSANQSQKSQDRTANYLNAKEQGKLTLLWQCADARSGPTLFNSDSIATDRSIAVGANPLGYAEAIRHRGIGQIIIAPHFDGVLSMEEGRFTGCGGQDAFHVFGGAHAQETHAHPVADFIGRQVVSDNPYVQGFKKKDEIMKQFSSDGDFKPIMVGAIDHRTGLFIPVWYSERDEDGIFHTHGTIQSHQLQNPNLITPRNVRPIPFDRLPQGFRDMVLGNQEYVVNHPEFPETQKVQDPSAIWVTTNLIPLRNRYADLCDSPNRFFVVGAPFVKETNGEIHVTDTSSILSQLSYPIDKTLHANEDGEPFYSTRTIVFEASDMGEAASLASSFVDTDFGQRWLREKDGKIMLVESISGTTKKVVEVPIR